ncbi:MAG TPA: T9SS type A sorting domain-containing protein [Flavobacteriales bacterium]|nr:T9SS type A sorting domain-containing protein [Flavobacteriales bacterium]
MKLATLSCLTLFTTTAVAQTVTVSTTPQNAEQVYYRLTDDAQTSAVLADWDIAFEITGITGSVLVNTAKGMSVYKAPYTAAQWSELDTAGLAAGWPEQQNSEINWSSGALNQGLTSNPFDLGWGIYDPVGHNITGDSLFVFRMADGAYKKFVVNGFAALTNSFTFTLADLDGGAELVGTLDRSDFAGKNFGYYSFASSSTMDMEPLASDWDLLFTKYRGFVTQPFPAFYPVAGVLQNREVLVQQVDGVPPADAQWDGQAMSADMNIIGFDWKNFDQGTLTWTYATDRTYFVKDRSGNIWKLVFTEYGGGMTGTITFTKELVSALSVDEVAAGHAFVLAPNPVTQDRVNLVIDTQVSELLLNILDASGRIVHEELLTGLGGLAQRTIQLNGLGQGLYVVRLQGQGINTTDRLVVE